MSTLRKNYDPGGAGGTIAGTPGTPSSPAYCLDVATTVPGTQTIFVPDDQNPGQFTAIVVSTGPVTVITHECFPPVAGTAPTAAITIAPAAARYFAGWNASAISIGQLTGDGIYTFSVPSDAVGVVTGFNSVNLGSGYIEIGHGIYCASGQFTIIEAGVEKTPARAFVSSDVFTVRRLGTAIAYYQNTTKIYTSTVPQAGTVFADASLYFGNDSIVGAALASTVPATYAGIGGGGVYDPPLVLTGGQPPATPPGSTPSFVTVAGALESLRGFAQDATGGGVVTSAPPVNPNDPGNGPGTSGGVDGNGDWPGRTGGVLRNLVGHAEADNQSATVGSGAGLPASGANASGDWPGRAGGQLRGLVGQAFAGDASHNYAFCAGVLTGLASDIESGFLQPSFAVGDGVLQGISGFALGFPANLMGTVNGRLGSLSGFATDLTGGQVVSGGPSPSGTVTSTLFADTFTGTGTLAAHQPDVGGAYTVDSAAGIPADYTLNGSGGLPSQSTTSTDVVAPLQAAPSGTYTLSETFNVTALGAATLSVDLGASTATGSVVDVALVWNGTTWTLTGTVNGTAYSSGPITVTSDLGVGVHTVAIVVTPTGVAFTIDGVVIATTSTVPTATPDRIDIGNHTSGGTSNVTLDAVTLTSTTADATAPDANGDWVGRIGGQLRNLVGLAYSGIPAQTYMVGANSGHYPFLGFAHFGQGIVDADGNPAPLNGIQGAHHGNYVLDAAGHADAEGTLPVGTFAGAGTLTNLGEAVGTLPHGTFFATGTFTTDGRFIGRHGGRYQLSASGHAVAAGMLPSGTFNAGATFTILGAAAGVLPRGTFTGSAHFDNFGIAIGVLPSLIAVPSGVAINVLPRGTFAGTGHWLVTATYEGYSFTFLETDPNGVPTLAATRYTNYPFDRIVRWKGHYYGVSATGIFLLEGDTFDGAPIIATVRGAESDLGVPNVKRTRSLFVTGEVGPDMAVQVISNEVDSAGRTYTQPIRAGARVHRYKLARGTKGNYLAFQFSNTRGKPFRIVKLTPEIEVSQRTI